MKNEKWRLYVAVTRNDTMKVALDEPYSKASGTHILIYKRGKCPAGYKEIKDENIGLLSSADMEWLKDVNIEVMKLFSKKHEEEMERAGNKFLNDFERELEIERKKLSENQGRVGV